MNKEENLRSIKNLMKDTDKFQQTIKIKEPIKMVPVKESTKEYRELSIT